MLSSAKTDKVVKMSMMESNSQQCTYSLPPKLCMPSAWPIISACSKAIPLIPMIRGVFFLYSNHYNYLWGSRNLVSTLPR